MPGAAKVTWKELDISFYLDALKQGICCVLGITKRGPLTATLVRSWSEFQRLYGGLMTDSDFPLMLKRYLERGGAAYIGRVVAYDVNGDPTVVKSMAAFTVIL